MGSKRLISGKRAMTIAIAVLAGVAFTGCGKPLAKWDIDKAEKLANQAGQWSAAKYDQSKSSYEQAMKSIKSAKQSYDGDDVEGAKTQAKEAVASAKSALEAATSQYAADQVAAAKTALEVARTNDGPTENAQLFERAEKALVDMDQYYSKQKFEKTIAASDTIQEDVRLLMASKKAAADARLEELSDLRKELATAKAEQYNAPALTGLDEQIAKFTTAVTKDRSYKKTTVEMTACVAATHEAIAETKRRNADDLLRQGQKLVDEALSEEAENFAGDNLKSVQNLMTETLQAYWDKQYDSAIASSEKLRDDASRLVNEARIENARDKITKTDTGIKKMEAENVEMYVPGRISNIADKYKKAGLFFANNDFQSAKLTAIDALTDLAALDTSFNDLAAVEIEKAGAVKAIATKTYDRMREVFANDQLWASAEARRLMEEANLGARLEKAQLMLTDANKSREAKSYQKGIEGGKSVLTDSEKIENDVYAVSARYTLLRVQSELSELERHNALTMAPVQVGQVMSDTNTAQGLLNDSKPREAVEVAARARVTIENVKQEMLRKAGVEQNRSDQMLRRLETGDTRDGNPGGSDLNNREAMMAEGGADVEALPVTNTVPAAGTTNNPLAQNASSASYEASTPGTPFVATPVVSEPQPDSVKGMWDQVEALINDEHRIQNVRKYYSSSIGEARTALQESQRKQDAKDYAGAYEAAKRSQRIILEAESKGARKAAQDNLGKAKNRMSLAQQAGSTLFAPSAMNEASNLISEAQKMINAGNNQQAYELSVKAVDATENARLYNVNKARETAALALRYGGNMSQHPLLTDSQINADLAEKMLNKPGCTLQGQEVAKLAVYQAQLALDHARDWTFQERLDNIYKALNTATRAGANWFNPVEVKRLVDELAAARAEYNTRNFDAVEVKLNDIEAGLGRVIETTPQILEQNVSEQTDRLNALLDAGAENYSATTIDEAKSALNNSVIDFRNQAYGSSYNNMDSAIKKVDQVEGTMQEQVYFDAVTELFDQLDDAFVKFSTVIETGPAFLKRLVTSPTGAAASISLAGRVNPNGFFDAINDIYLRGLHLAPPASQKGTHDKVLLCLKYARTSAQNFQKLYIMDQFDNQSANEVIDTAYDQMKKAKKLRSEIQLNMIEPDARKKVFKADKIINY